jgi:hypothetical protein
MPYVSARRRYVRFGFGRNNYCDCVDCVARASRVIRLGVHRGSNLPLMTFVTLTLPFGSVTEMFWVIGRPL